MEGANFRGHPRVVRGQEHDGHEAGQEGHLTHPRAVPGAEGRHAGDRRGVALTLHMAESPRVKLKLLIPFLN